MCVWVLQLFVELRAAAKFKAMSLSLLKYVKRVEGTLFMRTINMTLIKLGRIYISVYSVDLLLTDMFVLYNSSWLARVCTSLL